jgi:hypothetical protein
MGKNKVSGTFSLIGNSGVGAADESAAQIFASTSALRG